MSKGSIRARGKASWEIKFDISPDPETGNRRTKTKNVKGTKRDAQRELNRVLTEVQDQDYITPTKDTVRKVALNWLSQVAPHKNGAKSLEGHEGRINTHILPYIGNVELLKLTSDQIEKLYFTLRERGNRRTGKGLSEQTIIHVHSALSLILGWACRKGKVKINPLDRVENKPSKSLGETSSDIDEFEDGAQEVKLFEDEQLRFLLDETSGTAYYYPALTAAMTGLRRGEILGLKWKDIDLERGTLKVVRAVEQTKKYGLRLKVPKTKSSNRTINLPQSLLEGLRKHRKEQAETLLKLGVRQTDQNFVFATWDGNLRSPNGFTSEFGRIVKRLGLSDLGFHSLRHTHASALLREGVPITTVSKRLGHKNAAITLSIYSHVMVGMDEDAAASSDQMMNRIMGNR
jgi:integrase